MKHLGSALLLGVLLAMVLALAVWARPSFQSEQSWALSHRSSLQQLEHLDRPTDH
ncbi:MAG: hypothetical protein LZF60_260005 [Nitrospira sp.]|nr:MAG: hypothetical protein LZF60_260005 [Nitrospira sp.]